MIPKGVYSNMMVRQKEEFQIVLPPPYTGSEYERIVAERLLNIQVGYDGVGTNLSNYDLENIRRRNENHKPEAAPAPQDTLPLDLDNHDRFIP